MKKYLLITLTFFVVIVCFFVVYSLGFTNGQQKLEEQHLCFYLVFNVTNYNKLIEGKGNAVRDNLVIDISGEIKAYDFYKKKNPYFAAAYPRIAPYIEKARTIVSDNSGRMIEVPQKSQ